MQFILAVGLFALRVHVTVTSRLVNDGVKSFLTPVKKANLLPLLVYFTDSFSPCNAKRVKQYDHTFKEKLSLSLFLAGESANVHRHSSGSFIDVREIQLGEAIRHFSLS